MATLNESQKAVNGIVKRCEQLAINSCPVLIRGQHGTGKEDVAFFIYKNRRITDSLFISYDCQLICEEQWDSVFEDDNLDIFENSTIYIKEITALSLKNQAKLIKWLNKLVSSKNIKLLASSSEDINVLLEKNLFLYSLFELCAKAILRLKPLRDRKEDIESIISILLSDANIKYGKQVIGVEPAAMDMLKAFRWPNNITQLKNTVNQLVMCSEDTYVSRKDVCELLEAMDRDSCTDIILPPNKTLDEICEGIIEHVLEQENGNYTKVCKRLGISRSTLWRKSKGRKLTEIKL